MQKMTAAVQDPDAVIWFIFAEKSEIQRDLFPKRREGFLRAQTD